MRRRILAGVLAASIAAGGTLAVTEAPVKAEENCILLNLVRLTLGRGGSWDNILNICI